jgi:hypothetical protein
MKKRGTRLQWVKLESGLCYWLIAFNGMTLISTNVNVTNILRAVFAPIFLRQKSTILKCKFKKVASKTFAQKRLHAKCCVKLTPGLPCERQRRKKMGGIK